MLKHGSNVLKDSNIKHVNDVNKVIKHASTMLKHVSSVLTTWLKHPSKCAKTC